MDFELDSLRALLKDVPLSRNFTESLQLLDDAFNRFPRTSQPVWNDFRRGREVAFYGERTLRELLGENFIAMIEDRLETEIDTEDAPEEDLRFEMQRYAVLGRRRGSTPLQAECVIFHEGPVSFLDGAQCPQNMALAPLELVRVRAGLMNRRQAHLLANHLNRFRRNHHYYELLDWSVIRGPLPNSSARDWLDAVAGGQCQLQRTVGEIPRWGLGRNASEALVPYVVKRPRQVRQTHVFDYVSPRCLLPARFAVSAVASVRSCGVPDGNTWWAERTTEDASAYAFAQICEQAGLMNVSDPFEYVTALDFLGPASCGGSWDYPYTPYRARTYATSFSQDEALQVMMFLRKMGFKNIRAHRFGHHGQHVRQDATSVNYGGESLHPSCTFDIAGSPELRFKLSTTVIVHPASTPWEHRFEWEREALIASAQAKEPALNGQPETMSQVAKS